MQSYILIRMERKYNVYLKSFVVNDDKSKKATFLNCGEDVYFVVAHIDDGKLFLKTFFFNMSVIF